MAQLPLKVLAFLGAYAPLWAIYAVRLIRIDWRASIAFAAAAIVFPVIVVVYVTSSQRSGNGDDYTPAGVARRDEAVMAYLFTYVFPFVGMVFDDWVEVASAGIFLAVLLVLYVRTNLLYVNPVLSGLGYRIYEIQLLEAPPRIVLSKSRFLRVGEPIRVVRILGDDVYVDTGVRPI